LQKKTLGLRAIYFYNIDISFFSFRNLDEPERIVVVGLGMHHSKPVFEFNRQEIGKWYRTLLNYPGALQSFSGFSTHDCGGIDRHIAINV
jgi:hypothetical protein